MAVILHKRGTRAEVDAAATAAGLKEGEPYLVTDDGTPAIGISATTYANVPVISGAKRIAVVSELPGSPDADTIYFVTP